MRLKSGRISSWFHDILFTGSLKQGEDWGGDECASYVPFETHVYESLSWIAILYLLSIPLSISSTLGAMQKAAGKHQEANPIKAGGFQRRAEIAVATLFLCIFAWLFSIKYNNSCLIVLLQPCHLQLIIQAVALLSHGPLGVTLTMLQLPPLAGTLIAMLIPTMNGLSQLEIINFWVQHIMEGLVPLYLLCRHNFCASKLCKFSHLAIGQWGFNMLHWTMYEVIDVSFKVNPQFMICPTLALQDLFKSFPPYLLLPSYRTTVCIVFSLIGMFSAYIYVGLSRAFNFIYDLRWDIKLQLSNSENSLSAIEGNLANKSGKLGPLQGMRGLLSFWVVACHVATFLAYMQTVHPEKWRVEAVDKSLWFVTANGLGYQVDAFFMISGAVISTPHLFSSSNNLILRE